MYKLKKMNIIKSFILFIILFIGSNSLYSQIKVSNLTVSVAGSDSSKILNKRWDLIKRLSYQSNNILIDTNERDNRKLFYYFRRNEIQGGMKDSIGSTYKIKYSISDTFPFEIIFSTLEEEFCYYSPYKLYGNIMVMNVFCAKTRYSKIRKKYIHNYKFIESLILIAD